MYILPVIIFCCGILLGALPAIWQGLSISALLVYTAVGGFLGSALGGALFIYLYMTQSPGDTPEDLLPETEVATKRDQLSGPGNARPKQLSAPDNASTASRFESLPSGGDSDPSTDSHPASPKGPSTWFQDKQDRKKMKQIQTLEKKIALLKKKEKGN